MTPDRYPEEPLLPERLTTRFLRTARAMPIALEEDALVVAATDPLDPFIPSAISAATGRRVLLEVAVPIEIEAAFERLYRDDAAAAETAGGDEGNAPLEEDAERLKDLASEAPVIRLVNQLISRAVETRASDIHIEPFEDRLRVRYRYDGVLQEAEQPAGAAHRRDHLADENHGQARHRRAPAAAGRPHQAGGARPGGRFPCLHHSVALPARRWCCACSTAPRSRSTTASSACRRR